MNRSTRGYLYLVAVAGTTLITIWSSWRLVIAHPDNFIEVCYLVCAAIVLNRTEVRLERGRLTLLGIPIGAAAIGLNPLGAGLVGLSSSIAMVGRRPWPVIANGVLYAFIGTLGSWAARQFAYIGNVSLGERLIAVIVVNGAVIVLVGIGLSISSGESLASIFKQNLAGGFYLAFGYFALAALLMSYVLDGSAIGYVLASAVCVLALALTDTIAGRRLRKVLESELSDADRHLFHSRAVEGVVHNLRNHLATAVGYLKEIDVSRLDQVDRDAVETAAAAANDAATVLRTLSQGATPRVSYSPTPVDLNDLVVRALGMSRPRAKAKEIEVNFRQSPDEVKIKADPLLLREVLTNLVNNAIDAAPKNGRVSVATGRRGNGWPFVSVSDNGPGVSDENRHHLFEPHFTTKEGGTGLGLFMSYGIVREHQGQLIYEGTRRGAVFTVALPPFAG